MGNCLSCENVKNLPYMENLKIVAGNRGLDRIIKWVHYMENPEYIDWLKGGELIVITGILLNNKVAELLELVKNLYNKKVAGLVINVGPYIECTPKQVMDLADSLDFPLFELPFEVKIIDFSQSICKAIFNSKIEKESMENFMKEVMFNDIDYSEEIQNRAMLYGYNPDFEYCSLVVNIDNFTNFVGGSEEWDEETELRTKEQVEQKIMSVMNRFNKKTIHVSQSNSIIVIFPVNEKDKAHSIDLIANDIIHEIAIKIKALQISIGIGSCWRKLQDLKKSVYKSQKALKVLRIKGSENRVCKYSDIGIYRLLFELEKNNEMKVLYEETLGELIAYDKKNSTDLVNTLEALINKDCNLIRTAEALFIHKNTLKYRIKRIEEILQCDLKNLEQILNFSVAFKVGKFL
jgi:DNA-binding PucR family transcriptional regulator